MLNTKIEKIYHVDDKVIHGFFKENRFLSNFHSCEIVYEGDTYQSTEAAYQAAKSLDKEIRKKFFNATPSEAKKMGQSVKLREDWENVKDEIMLQLLVYKFTKHHDLRKKLLATHPKELEETNYWGDRYWGADEKHVGVNKLGQLLMTVRDEVFLNK